MEKIYIVGASGLAKEIANYILDTGHEIAGFIEKDENLTEEYLLIRNISYPTIKESIFLQSATTAINKPQVVIAIGFPVPRFKVYTAYKDLCNFPNIIHPKAVLCDTSIELGIGNIIAPGCILTTSIEIGNFNLFNLSLTIGHDVRIGDYNVFNPLVSISGAVHIGNKNLLGCSSAVIQGTRIGNNNIIGMGAVVLKSVENDLTVAGIPAKVITKH